MEHRFGIAGRLFTAAEDEIAGSLERDRTVEIRRHRCVGGVALILPVDDSGHFLHHRHHRGVVAYAMVEPVGDMLRGDAQGCAVFHQSDVMNVRYFRASDSLVDPADNIAKDALGVVAEFLADIVRRPVRADGDRDRQDVFAAGAGASREFRLSVGDIHLVVVKRMQRRRCRRRHPGAVRAGHRVADLLFQHVGHPVRHCPHALADLRPAGKPACEADIDVPVLIGADPGRALHIRLADHRTGFHRGVDFVTGPVEEAGVDEDHT